MGYICNFYIKFENLNEFSEETKEDIYQCLSDNLEYFDNFFEREPFFKESEVGIYSMKWTHEMMGDLLNISKSFPKLKFYLDTYGEEDGDISRTFYYNGKSVETKATITFEKSPLW